MQAAAVASSGNQHSDEYNDYRKRMGERFLKNVDGGVPLFTTDVNPDAIWEAYLASFPESDRQYHNCSACRHFLTRFAALVTIDENGMAASPMWDEDDAPGEYKPAVRAFLSLLRRAKVTGVFLSREQALGTPVTGEWTHFSVVAPKHIVPNHSLLTAGQLMAEKRQDYATVSRALGEFSIQVIDQAVALLKSDALYRSDKILAPAEWLQTLHGQAVRGVRKNMIWRAIATAPAGFCHPRSSMIGTLLEDLAAGVPFEDAKRKFVAKMHPLQYQRPQAAPSMGSIQRAEEIVAKLGIARSLERRFARIDECKAIWRPQPKETQPSEQVFGHLKAKGVVQPGVIRKDAPTSWVKFAETVLPGTVSLQIEVPRRGDFIAIVTAAHDDSPPILQWDREESRNPASWYRYTSRYGGNGSACEQWGLSPGWLDVLAISTHPARWGGEYHSLDKMLVALLPGACDANSHQLGLFPETLRPELREIRSVIEAHSKSRGLAPIADAACGLGLPGAKVRATDSSGITVEHVIDRWD